MQIVLHEGQRRLVTLDKRGLHLFDVGKTGATFVKTQALRNGCCVAACDRYVAVVKGRSAPDGVYADNATLARFRWTLTPLRAMALGEHVGGNGIGISPDGKYVAFADRGAGNTAVANVLTGARRTFQDEDHEATSGPSWSPDGAHVISAHSDQGTGAVWLIDAASKGRTLQAVKMPDANGSMGLDDAYFVGAFGRKSRLAAVSIGNQGYYGLAVFDVRTREPVFGTKFEYIEEDDSEQWAPLDIAFAADDKLLLVIGPGWLRAYRTRDGRDLGVIEVPGDRRMGFAVEHAARRVWVPNDGEPTSHAFAATWA